jgi:hypothetical protein
MEFRLRTSFQTKVVALTVTDNLLYYRTHLVHLHRKDYEVFGLIVIFLCGLAEALVGLLDAVVQNIWETK